jgi:hypothetical protein
MFEQPQRHRDTEKTQSHPFVPAEPLGGGAVPTSQTRRHKGTKATHATEKPQITQINVDVLTDVMQRYLRLTAELSAI